MRLIEWLAAGAGIAHREQAERAVGVREVRRALAAGDVRRVRRSWLVIESAPQELVTAAEGGGLLTCVSLARRRGWWMPEGTGRAVHLHMPPHQASPRERLDPPPVLHWTKRIAPPPRHALHTSVEDALAHIAHCLDAEASLVVWESAIRVERLSLDALREVRWPSRAARACAEQADGLSDSGLETIAVVRLRPWGIPIRQQIVIAGRPVDLLIGERLILQIDGYAHHSSAAQRGRDIAHDAELRLRGYTVVRVSYAQVMYDWPAVERLIARAVAAGAHLSR